MFASGDQLRSRLLVLRVHMDDVMAEAHIGAPSVSASNVTTTDAGAIVAFAASSIARKVADELRDVSPDRRRVVFELSYHGQLIGEWWATGRDLGLVFDPQAVLSLPAKFRATVAGLTARSTIALSSWVPYLTTIAAEGARAALAPSLGLPLSVAQGLTAVLEQSAPDRRVLWLDIAQPAGYIPFLNWEEILRPLVGVPIVRLPARLVDPVSPRNTLDVLMTCSSATTDAIIDTKRVALLTREILACVPEPRRCVVHLFADEIYRAPLLDALKKATVRVTEEPTNEIRGVVLYRLPEASETSVSDPSEDARNEHPWAAWVAGCLAGTAVDVVHVIADGYLSQSAAALRVSASPRATTEPLAGRSSHETKQAPKTTLWSFKGEEPPGVRVRYVDALQMNHFARRVGAWGTILSPARASARDALRVLTYQLAQTATGVFALYEFGADSDSKAAGSLYHMLVAERVTPRATANDVAVPDTNLVSLYCHPDRIIDEERRTAAGAPHGDELAVAVESVAKIRAAMEQPAATPAWLAVTQRYLEDAASRYLEGSPSTDRERAARDGVGDALKFALHAIAQNSMKQKPQVDAMSDTRIDG